MNNKEHKEYVKKAKQCYHKIKFVRCPAFSNEKILFTERGFNHLLKKDRKYRSHHEQVRRLGLIRHVASILSKCNKFDSHRVTSRINEDDKRKSIANFWSFSKIKNKAKVIVVVCQINNEPKIFMSVMDKDVDEL
jgi:hypothetical protein